MIYIGSYSTEGIIAMDFDESSLQLRPVQKVSGTVNPSYLCKNGNRLYACFETNQYSSEGGIAEYELLPDGLIGELKQVVPSGGDGPCHLSTDVSGKWLFAANYNAGTAAVYSLGNNGEILRRTAHIAHIGSGPDISRQGSAHAHFAALSPDESRLYIVDLGLDAIVIYPFDNVNGTVNESKRILLQSPVPGAGPRHMLFGQDGLLYIVYEMGNILAVYSEKTGHFLQIAATIMEGSDVFSTAAAIRFSPCGRYIIASNRGDDSLASFRVEEDGRLTKTSTAKVHGKTPRDFNFICGGKYVLSANQDTDDITLLSFSDGKLEYIKLVYNTLAPTFVAEL